MFRVSFRIRISQIEGTFARFTSDFYMHSYVNGVAKRPTVAPLTGDSCDETNAYAQKGVYFMHILID